MKSRQCLSVKLQTECIDRSREDGVRWSGGGVGVGGGGGGVLPGKHRQEKELTPF